MLENCVNFPAKTETFVKKECEAENRIDVIDHLKQEHIQMY